MFLSQKVKSVFLDFFELISAVFFFDDDVKRWIIQGRELPQVCQESGRRSFSHEVMAVVRLAVL